MCLIVKGIVLQLKADLPKNRVLKYLPQQFTMFITTGVNYPKLNTYRQNQRKFDSVVRYAKHTHRAN